MRRKPTLDDYVEAGAYMRLLYEIMGKAHTAMSKILPVQNTDRFFRLDRHIGILKDQADTKLHNDFSHSDNYYNLDHVFYGRLYYSGGEGDNNLNREVISKAKELSDHLFISTPRVCTECYNYRHYRTRYWCHQYLVENGEPREIPKQGKPDWCPMGEGEI